MISASSRSFAIRSPASLVTASSFASTSCSGPCLPLFGSFVVSFVFSVIVVTFQVDGLYSP